MAVCSAVALPSLAFGGGCAGRHPALIPARPSLARAATRLSAEKEDGSGSPVDWDASWQSFKKGVEEGVPEVEARSRVQTKPPR